MLTSFGSLQVTGYKGGFLLTRKFAVLQNNTSWSRKLQTLEILMNFSGKLDIQAERRHIPRKDWKESQTLSHQAG
jgi:hypothetical protein